MSREPDRDTWKPLGDLAARLVQQAAARTQEQTSGAPVALCEADSKQRRQS